MPRCWWNFLLAGNGTLHLVLRRGQEGLVCIFGFAENNCSPRSSPRRQRSSALHLNRSSPGKIVRTSTASVLLNISEVLARQEGLEPPTYCLEGSCSIQLSYWRISGGAGDGNRTRVSSLEGWCSTIELHPQIHLAWLIQP